LEFIVFSILIGMMVINSEWIGVRVRLMLEVGLGFGLGFGLV
jgi:hypothetical protein